MKIRGTVVDSAKQPLPGVRIVTYHGDVNLTRDKKLAAAKTTRDGRYTVTVDLAPYPLGLNVHLSVFNAHSKEIWSSPIFYNARNDLVIDAAIPDVQLGVSEYERLMGKVMPLLQGTNLSTLQWTQTAYLAGRSGIAQAEISSLVAAAQLHDKIPTISAEAFYGLLRQGLPSSPPELVASSENVWKTALDTAQRANIISALSPRKSGAIIAALNRQKAAAIIRRSSDLVGTAPAAFVPAALKSKTKQQAIARLAAQHDGVNGKFWKAVAASTAFTPGEKNRLKNYAATSEALGNNPQMLTQIVTHLTKNGEQIAPAAIAKITSGKLSRFWEKAARVNSKNSASGARKLKASAATKAVALANQMAARFPTQALQAELHTTPRGTYFGRHVRGLSKFFDRNPEFDLRKSLYPVLNPSRGQDPFRGIPNKDAVKDRVVTLGRLFRVMPEAQTTAPGATPSVEAGIFSKISMLADKGYSSSSAIANIGRGEFVTELAGKRGDSIYWGQVHDRATAIRDLTQFKSIELLQGYGQSLPIMHGLSSSTPPSGSADLRTLFGPLDTCDCEECASVTSPAAYLADILNFLDTDVATGQGLTPYAALIRRRPDIPHLLLNCDNANRVLPYIDLVNELLQDEVIRGSGAKCVWAPYRSTQINVAPSILDDAADQNDAMPTRAAAAINAKRLLAKVLNDTLPNYGFDLDMEVSVLGQDKKSSVGNQWQIFDKGWLLELSQVENTKKIRVDYISRQTYGTEAELAANPAFRDSRASNILEGAKYPLSLPPALSLFETRLFLNHLQVPRERLIKLLSPKNSAGWSVEYLGLSATEASLIADPSAMTPFEAWGFSSATVTTSDALVDPADSTKWLTGSVSDLLRRVDVLIARAGITYIELLDLLVTDYINPPLNGVRPITIQSIDNKDPATCDLTKLRITGSYGATATSGIPSYAKSSATTQSSNIAAPGDFLDRLARFLRLKRRTGWSTPDLDLAIRQVRPALIDNTTLSLLAALKWTRKTLSLNHSEACALFGGIDTTRYIDHAADNQPALPSQYDQLFLNRVITNPLDRNFALNDGRSQLRNSALSLSLGKATVAAAFEITEAEVDSLAQKSGIATLNLQNLSAIYRRVLLARGFKLSVEEFIKLGDLAGPLPQGLDLPPFVEQVQRLLQSRVSVTDAWFLLRDSDASTAYLEPRDDEIVQTLGELRDELQKIDAEHTADPPDPDGTLLRKRLGELDWGAQLIDSLVGAVDDTKVFSVPLASLPSAVRALLTPGPGDPVGAPLAANAIPNGVDDLVVYDSDNGILRALRKLDRSDRKQLLVAGDQQLTAAKMTKFQGAVDLLFALGKLGYDSNNSLLMCRGVLPADGIAALRLLAQAQSYQNSLGKLADQQRQLLTRKLRYCSLPQYELPLDQATTFSLPDELTSYVYYDPDKKLVVIRGQLTDAEQVALKDGAAPPLPQATVQALPTPSNPGATAANQAELVDLLTNSAAVDELFDPAVDPAMPATTAEISASLLKKLTPYANDVLSRKAVVTELSSAFGLGMDVAQDLLENRLSSAMTGSPRMIDGFLAIRGSDARAPVDITQYAGLFDDYRRLSKLALLFQRLNLQFVQLPWVFDYAANGKWLAGIQLATGAATGTAGLPEISELVRLFTVSVRSPYSQTLIDDILQIANGPTDRFDDIIQLLQSNSTWPSGDLTQICQALSISTSSDFRTAKALDDLHNALAAAGQIGASADQALQLTKDTLVDADAQLAKKLAKSKHDNSRWFDIVKPISNSLREARRSALVDYLVANPRQSAGQPLWHDANTLYDYLLVDVQMSACMSTSRIRLALSSVQLFVQRCLMNLEPTVNVNDDPIARECWNEWESWRKLYRVWEANRLIFLHPQDWIEPELRDDKTPFFVELENELLQGDVTQDSAETAYLNYLQKLDQVARLEVMGMFIENSSQVASIQAADSEPAASAGAANAASNSNAEKRVLHVIARTYGEPHVWFYRTLSTTSEWHKGLWSPWQKIDVDITGDHVLPILWNHRLYLFWALFEQKTDKPTAAERKEGDTARKRWCVKLAWSEHKNGVWSPKRISADSLATPAVDSDDNTFAETDFSFKSSIADDKISINCYGPATTNTATTVAASPSKNGQFLWSGTANSSFTFVDQDWKVLPNIIVYVYPANGDSTELFELRSGTDGRVQFWDEYGDQLNDWRLNTTIEVRIDTDQVILEAWNYVPWNWAEAAQAGRQKFMAYYSRLARQSSTTSQGISSFQGPTVTLPSDTSVSPQALPFTRMGRFDFLACRGDVQPVPVSLSERIPDFEIGASYQSTKLEGMMYVEREGDIENNTRVPSQPFLRDVFYTTTSGVYRVLLPHQFLAPDTTQPFFFQDDSRVFLVTMPQTNAPGVAPNSHRFDVFYHPYVCDFIASVNSKDLEALLTLQSQSQDDNGANFTNVYTPDHTRVQLSEPDSSGTPVPITREYVDFTTSGSYSIYNWELFFHAPFRIATMLMTNQRFEEARNWFHSIFDPTTRPGAFNPGQQKKPTQRFWNFRPFWEAEGQEILSIDELLRGTEDLSEQYVKWREEPFQPFVLARLRQTAFMQSVVMHYLDSLIAWGDQQFSIPSVEATDEATLLYVRAAEILGPPPQKIPPRAHTGLQTYLSLQQQAASTLGKPSSDVWRNFSDLMVQIEAYITPAAVSVGSAESSALGRMWAFCIPSNGKLLDYWLQVSNRLFNLRHCKDITGAERTIPLWDPPIDPGLLVRAAAAGMDLASILGDINAALPHYRFNVMVQKALELCGEVRNFGTALLAALEKKDAEDLAQLRSEQEVGLLKAMRAVKENQLEENTAQREAAEKSKLTVETRRDYYRDIAYLNAGEAAGLTLTGLALTQEGVAVASDAIAAIAAWVPQEHAGTSGTYGSPVAVVEYGGEQVSHAAGAAASLARSSAAIFSTMSAAAQTLAGYQRRWEDWKLQETLANKELDQIDKQILAAQIRESIAQIEIANNNLQVGNAQAVYELLRSKYTNRELYSWLQTQLSALYFQAYKIAFDVAKKAERAFRYELGLDDSNFVQFGYWDSLKKGLLAGERLESDLRRMEMAYLGQNRREFEITRHVSLAALNPAALIALKAVGACEIDIPEWLFDMDYRGHYMRRIKSVALSVPCVAGRYTNVNCTLTQLFSKVRTDNDVTDTTDYASSDYFHENYGGAQTIVTSTAREDSGLFELNFRDDRYLPFEGTGVISRWRVQLPADTNQFDVGTVSDVIFHIRYTARPGSDALSQAATDALPKTGMRIFDTRTEFNTEWYRFKNPDPGQNAKLSFSLTDDQFPFHSPNYSIAVQSIELISSADQNASSQMKLGVKLGTKPIVNYSLGVGSGPGDLRSQEQKFNAALGDLAISADEADVAHINELMLLCRYELRPV